jgi:hypothetical protein
VLPASGLPLSQYYSYQFIALKEVNALNEVNVLNEVNALNKVKGIGGSLYRSLIGYSMWTNNPNPK